jgi:hypothetical protein
MFGKKGKSLKIDTITSTPGIFNSSVHAKLVEVSEEEESQDPAGEKCQKEEDLAADGDDDVDDDDRYLRKNASLNRNRFDESQLRPKTFRTNFLSSSFG